MATRPPLVALGTAAALCATLFQPGCGCKDEMELAAGEPWAPAIEPMPEVVVRLSDHLQEQFLLATSDANASWASQPGALMIFKGGKRTGRLRLYSHPEPVAGGEIDLSKDIPVDWRSQPKRFVDINAPAAASGARPILDTADAPEFPARWIYVTDEGTLAFADEEGAFRDRYGKLLRHPRHAVMRYAYWIDDETCKTYAPDKAESDPWHITAHGRSPETTLYGTPRWACRNSRLVSHPSIRSAQLDSECADTLPRLSMLPWPPENPSHWEIHPDYDLHGFNRVGRLGKMTLQGFTPGFEESLHAKYGGGPYQDGSQILASAAGALNAPARHIQQHGYLDSPIAGSLRPICYCGGSEAHAARWDKPWLKFPLSLGRAFTIREVAFVFRCVAKRNSEEAGVGEGWRELSIGERLVEATLLLDIVIPTYHPHPFVPDGSINIVGGRFGLDRPPPSFSINGELLSELGATIVQNTPGKSYRGGRVGVRLFSREGGTGKAMTWKHRVVIPAGAASMKFSQGEDPHDFLRLVLTTEHGGATAYNNFQSFVIATPDVELPVPDFDAERGQLSFEQRLDDISHPVVLETDVVRSMIPPHADYRLISSRRRHAKTDFVPHPEYHNPAVRHAHSLYDSRKLTADSPSRVHGDWSRAEKGIEGSFLIWERRAIDPQLAVLGQIPTGVQSQSPYRTLLLRPQPEHPSSGGAPDHLLLDLFWQPEIGMHGYTQWSAGKANLNRKIVPFHIEREDALADALRELTLRDHETGEDRYLVDIPATLAQWRQREAEHKMGYRTASEACELDIVWRDRNGVVPDLNLFPENYREKPYIDLYRKTTARSQSFLAHVVAERLPGGRSKPERWVGRIWLERKIPETEDTHSKPEWELNTRIEDLYEVRVRQIQTLTDAGWKVTPLGNSASTHGPRITTPPLRAKRLIGASVSE